MTINRPSGPHQGQPILHTGAEIGEARLAMIMIHGRGADAASILTLAESFERHDVAYLAPEAAGHAWYPNTFLAPVERNEPGRSSGLTLIAGILNELDQRDLPPEKVALLGFSQGACLALEFAARAPRRYGAVIGLSGGLIGEAIDPEEYEGSLAGTPVFLGCSDRDAHIPLARVQETTNVLRRLGGAVVERIYPGMGHTVSDDEIAEVRRLLEEMAAAP